MISSTKCISTNENHDVNSNTQQSSQNINFLSSQIANICNLPVEIKQMIAFNLNSKDYSSLRLMSKNMSENLESFSAMYNKLEQNKVSGDTEKNFREMLRDNRIRKLLGGDQTKEITLSLKNCFSRPDPLFKRDTEVGTEYLPDHYRPGDPDRICEVVDLCREAITSFIPSGWSRSFRPEIYPGEYWSVSMKFRDSDINPKSLNDIFSSYNKVYHNTQGTEKYVVANLASTLRNYWAETPPSNVSKEDVIHISNTYPELFRAGDNIVEVLKESTQ